MEKLLTHAYEKNCFFFSILISSGDKFGLHDGLCKTDDGCVPTSIHAIFRLKFTNMETAMLSVTSATEQSPSIILLKDLVLNGVGWKGEGGGRPKLSGVCVRVHKFL
jgi:hypothetical protein